MKDGGVDMIIINVTITILDSNRWIDMKDGGVDMIIINVTYYYFR